MSGDGDHLYFLVVTCDCLSNIRDRRFDVKILNVVSVFIEE